MFLAKLFFQDEVTELPANTEAEAQLLVDKYIADCDVPGEDIELPYNTTIEEVNDNDLANCKVVTPEVLSEMFQAALDNWDFSVMEESPKYIEAYKSAIDGNTPEWVKRNLANDEGYCVNPFSNWWDWIDEFAKSTAANA